MKKLVTGVLLILLSVSVVYAGGTVNTVWEKSVAQGTKPNWFDTGNLTRGFAYGKVGGNDRLFVVSRNAGSFIYILDAANGDSLGKLDNRNITGGTYHVSDVGVSDDGIIYVCNLAVAGTFKVYKWTAETDTPLVAFTYDATGKRLGDKMTVTGSASDNSLVIWAASANSNQVVKFTTSDNGATFAPTVLDIGITGGSASVGPLPDASFYWNAGGNSVKKFTAAGVVLGTVPGSVVATGSNAIRFLTTVGSDELFATFQYGANNENARVVMVPNGDVTMATSYGLTTTLGTNANANGT
ncbi:MAG: DUF5018 domain-containing protein, partial [bacterium]|nr:DUF5018 domain-containing protein [bacterium]